MHRYMSIEFYIHNVETEMPRRVSEKIIDLSSLSKKKHLNIEDTFSVKLETYKTVI